VGSPSAGALSLDPEEFERLPDRLVGRLAVFVDVARLARVGSSEPLDDFDERRLPLLGGRRSGGAARRWGVSQYGQMVHRGSIGFPQDSHGSLIRARQFGHRRKVRSTGCSQFGHEASSSWRTRSSEALISSSRSRLSARNSGGRRIE
jgi:hypothetical protein